MELHLKIGGTFLMLLGAIHIIFPRYFNWKEELASLRVINRQMMYVHSFFIALTVFLMGVLCTTSSTDMINTALGKTICSGLGLFWAIRFIIQLFVYSSETWKGKKFETIVHIFFSFFWLYLSIVFLSASAE